MHTQVYLSLALAAQLSNAAHVPQAHTMSELKKNVGLPWLEKRQSVASTLVTMMNAPYGKTKGTLPTRVELPSRYPKIPGYKSVKIRYGPYKVPNMNVKTKTLTGTEEGMLWNYPDMKIEKPCQTCMIVGIEPDYEDLTGKSVNADTGHWLHHIVLLNSNKQADPTCAKKSNSLPHWVVGHTSQSSERFFASGNERSIVRLHDHNITDAGYKVTPSDTFAMIVDLMNMNPVDNSLYVVIKYDYIEGKPAGLKEIKPIWLDVDQCAFSEAKPKNQNGAYRLTSIPWRSTVDGELLVMGGHIHDGGTGAVIKADGKVVCDSRAGYGETPAFVSPMGGHGGSGGHAMSAPTSKQSGAKGKGKGKMANVVARQDGGHGHSTPGQKHISSMVLCWKGQTGKKALAIPTIKSGQSWVVEADYDYQKFNGAKHSNGQQENVMAIGIIWVKKNA